ncbi:MULTISPECIES: hypothetical protein [Bradyrhizobium]|uniref:Lipoprotein n=2 Tax=Bradyrhizobium TaxID=374 RepID=A0ABY0PK47_9BRAD|nr:MULTISPECIES: hypothetical protein [Bradyrhizobium]SDI55682.1 hypothetical protein SAMN05444163_3115 [Bradyrhizobium ottawaense]SED41775.1 hypothetical protein SAMN05444171_4054 [Bradyrhizobium lablabi]
MQRFAWLLIVLILGGCSIYPLPEDYLPSNTDQPYTSDRIAATIRCQTRDAIRAVIRRNIAAVPASYIVYQRMARDEMLAWLDSNSANYRALKWPLFAPELRKPFEFYKDTNISYDFTIDSTEMNTLGLNITLLKALNAGTDTIGLLAKNDRTREASRHFRVFDTFDSLARLMKEEACQNQPQAPNYLFPTAGLLRINTLVDSFLVANQWENLAGDKTDYTTAQMTDTLTFTTKSTGNFDPSTTTNSVVGRFVPSSAGLNVDNFRQDLHTIIILVSLPPTKNGIPQFDEYGRILAPGKAGVRAAASEGLDRQREINTQNALTRLGTGVGRLNVP